MKYKLIFIVAVLIAIATGCSQNTAQVKEVHAELTHAEKVKRGEYLVNAIGCDDCHSPKKLTPQGLAIIDELRFSGYQASQTKTPVEKSALEKGWILFGGDLTTAVGPWGQSFSANISSDETGIGNMTEENFMTVLRKGKYKGLDAGRDLLPPMPWFVYKNLSDDDIKSIYAFLQSTKPVHNIVPAPVPPNEL